MAAMAGILNHQMTAGQALAAKGPNPMAASTTGTGAANGTGSASSSSGNSATISANDFLSLLVTEMQNQDPTAQTDPNEYINQLVQVNSLEQLIDINQNLTTAIGSTGSTPTGAAPPSVSGAPGAVASSALSPKAGALTATQPAAANAPGASTVAAISQFAQSAGAKDAPGNLSVPAARPASHTVGHALDGHSHLAGIPRK
jgi:flagellar basal-body rod modification protein FlgD